MTKNTMEEVQGPTKVFIAIHALGANALHIQDIKICNMGSKFLSIAYRHKNPMRKLGVIMDQTRLLSFYDQNSFGTQFGHGLDQIFRSYKYRTWLNIADISIFSHTRSYHKIQEEKKGKFAIFGINGQLGCQNCNKDS